MFTDSHKLLFVKAAIAGTIDVVENFFVPGQLFQGHADTVFHGGILRKGLDHIISNLHHNLFQQGRNILKMIIK